MSTLQNAELKQTEQDLKALVANPNGLFEARTPLEQQAGLLLEEVIKRTREATLTLISSAHLNLNFRLANQPHGQALMAIIDMGLSYKNAEKTLANMTPLDIATIKFAAKFQKEDSPEHNALTRIAHHKTSLQRQSTVDDASVIPNIDEIESPANKLSKAAAEYIKAMESGASGGTVPTNDNTEKRSAITRAICLAITFPEHEASKTFMRSYKRNTTGSLGLTRSGFSDLRKFVEDMKQDYSTIQNALKECAPDGNDNQLRQRIQSSMGKQAEFLFSLNFEKLENAASIRPIIDFERPGNDAALISVNLDRSVLNGRITNGLSAQGIVSDNKAVLGILLNNSVQGTFSPKIRPRPDEQGMRIRITDSDSADNEALEVQCTEAFRDAQRTPMEQTALNSRDRTPDAWSQHIERRQNSVLSEIQGLSKDNPHQFIHNASAKIEKLYQELLSRAYKIFTDYQELNNKLAALDPEAQAAAPEAKAAAPSEPESPPVNNPWELTEESLEAVTAGGIDWNLGPQEIDWNVDPRQHSLGAVKEEDLTTTNFRNLKIGDPGFG